MAFLIFTYTPDGGKLNSVTPYDDIPYGFENQDNAAGVEYNYNPEVEFISALVLSEDRKTVTNKYPGKTVEEQKELWQQEIDQEEFSHDLNISVGIIKAQVRSLIEKLRFAELRAKELDAINQNTDNQTILARWRSAVRDANNSHEQLLLSSVTTKEELDQFNLNWSTKFLSENPVPEFD